MPYGNVDGPLQRPLTVLRPGASEYQLCPMDDVRHRSGQRGSARRIRWSTTGSGCRVGDHSNPSLLTETLTVRHRLNLAWLFHNETRRSQVLVKRPVAPPGAKTRQRGSRPIQSTGCGTVQSRMYRMFGVSRRAGVWGTPVALGPLNRRPALCLGVTAPLQIFGYLWLLAIQGGVRGRDNMGRWLP